jgi:hypothetical protein
VRRADARYCSAACASVARAKIQLVTRLIESGVLLVGLEELHEGINLGEKRLSAL